MFTSIKSISLQVLFCFFGLPLYATEPSPTTVIFSDELILSPSFSRIKPKTVYELAVELGGDNFNPKSWLEVPPERDSDDPKKDRFNFERRLSWGHFFSSIISQFRRSISQFAVANPARSWVYRQVTADKNSLPVDDHVPVNLSYGLKIEDFTKLLSGASVRGVYSKSLETSVLAISNFEICRSNQEGPFEERSYFQSLYTSLTRHVGLLVENGVKKHRIVWVKPYPVHQILAIPQLLDLKLNEESDENQSSNNHKSLFLWEVAKAGEDVPKQGLLSRSPAFLYMMMNCPSLIALTEDLLPERAEAAANSQRNMSDISMLALQQVSDNFKKDIEIEVSIVDPLAGKLLSSEDVDTSGFFPSEAYQGKVALGVYQALK